MQVLRDSLVSILSHIDLYRSDSSAVATGVVKCLEFLSRQEAKKEDMPQGGPLPAGGAAPVLLPDPLDTMDTEDSRFGNFGYQAAGEFEDGEGDVEPDEEDVEEEEEERYGRRRCGGLGRWRRPRRHG
jgi:hypothetical protein